MNATEIFSIFQRGVNKRMPIALGDTAPLLSIDPPEIFEKPVKPSEFFSIKIHRARKRDPFPAAVAWDPLDGGGTSLHLPLPQTPGPRFRRNGRWGASPSGCTASPG